LHLLSPAILAAILIDGDTISTMLDTVSEPEHLKIFAERISELITQMSNRYFFLNEETFICHIHSIREKK